MHVMIDHMPHTGRATPLGRAVRPARGRAAPAAPGLPVKVASDVRPAGGHMGKLAVAAAIILLAVLSGLAAAALAAMPAPSHTQSLGGAPMVSGVAPDGFAQGPIAFDTGSPAYRIDPATYEMTLPQQDARTVRPKTGIAWTTRWPVLWTASNGFVQLVLTFGFLAIGGIFLASVARPDVEIGAAGPGVKAS